MLLSAQYEEVLNDMMQEFVQEAGYNNIYRKAGHCLFWPMVGRLYGDSQRILFIGKSVNTWDEGHFDCHTLGDNLDSIGDFVERVKDFSEQDKLQWIRREKYKIPRFWQAIKGITMGVNPANDGNWENYVAWSNLIKIAPNKKMTSPNGYEWESQIKSCKKLLKMEIQELKPNTIVIMAPDEEWYSPFLDYLNCTLSNQGQYILGSTQIEDSTLIVTTRPDSTIYGTRVKDFIEEVVTRIRTADADN